MIIENTTTQASAATDARERLLNLISGQVKSVRAIREERINWQRASTDLFKQLAMGAEQVRPASQLEPREPATQDEK